MALELSELVNPAHTALVTQECQRGEAPEQHLWELQLVQQREGAALGATGSMALYDSPGWRILRHDYLSTSAGPSPSTSRPGTLASR